MSEDFTIVHSDHLVTVLQGDDVVGHIIPTYSGYVPFFFVESTGVFEELTNTDSLRGAKLMIQDLFTMRERAAGGAPNANNY